MDIIVLIGRVLFSLLLFATAAAQFIQSAAMTGCAKSKGVPPRKPRWLAEGCCWGSGPSCTARAPFKNLALAGASLLLVAFFAYVGDDLGTP